MRPESPERLRLTFFFSAIGVMTSMASLVISRRLKGSFSSEIDFSSSFESLMILSLFQMIIDYFIGKNMREGWA